MLGRCQRDNKDGGHYKLIVIIITKLFFKKIKSNFNILTMFEDFLHYFVIVSSDFFKKVGIGENIPINLRGDLEIILKGKLVG
jgi:hypothetical protein